MIRTKKNQFQINFSETVHFFVETYDEPSNSHRKEVSDFNDLAIKTPKDNHINKQNNLDLDSDDILNDIFALPDIHDVSTEKVSEHQPINKQCDYINEDNDNDFLLDDLMDIIDCKCTIKLFLFFYALYKLNVYIVIMLC